MRRALAVVVATGMALTLFSGVASAHRFRKATTLKINVVGGPFQPGEDVMVTGQLKPKKCWSRQTVELYQKVPGGARGNDVLLDTDRSDAEGDLKFKFEATDDIRIYARFAGSTEGGYGHNHRCRASQSEVEQVQVTG